MTGRKTVIRKPWPVLTERERKQLRKIVRMTIPGVAATEGLIEIAKAIQRRRMPRRIRRK